MLRSGGGAPAGVRYNIVPFTRGAGIELGHGPEKAFPHFIGVRLHGDETITPDVQPELSVHEWADTIKSIKPHVLDYVFKRVDVPMSAAEDIASKLLKDGGYFVIERKVGCLKVFQLTGDRFESVSTASAPEGTKTACVVRYGAIGDTIQSTSILDELKRQGYHVTWMCEPSGHEILKADPRIDAFFVQDKDQVPNHELHEFWKVQTLRFDRFINLCESVEGALIKLPGRSDHRWPHALRHEMCDHNYMEFTAKLAELPFFPEYHFHETAEERSWARNRIADIADQQNKGLQLGMVGKRPFVIMWALSGSSTHKSYPHMDAVIARLLTEISHAHVLLVGDYACQILEVGWENEPRVHALSGELEIRKTLALAKQCDMVIGPETGVMNGVAFESMPKILILSHSSVTNLSRDWTNTTSLHADDVPCYPCHQLHYTSEFCPREEQSHAAMCAFNVRPAAVWDAIQAAYVGRETVNRILTP